MVYRFRGKICLPLVIYDTVLLLWTAWWDGSSWERRGYKSAGRVDWAENQDLQDSEHGSLWKGFTDLLNRGHIFENKIAAIKNKIAAITNKMAAIKNKMAGKNSNS